MFLEDNFVDYLEFYFFFTLQNLIFLKKKSIRVLHGLNLRKTSTPKLLQ